jgi:predicted amidohydrolase
MKLSVIQPNLIWEDISSNLNNLERLILPLSGKTDIVVLPEMFNTGFTMNVKAHSELPDGETFRWMSDICRTGKFAICGSYLVEAGDFIYNRWIFTGTAGEFHSYDKRHTFTMGEEDKYISHGNSRIVFNYGGFRISPYICYDLRFPVWSRNRGDTDLMIYSANWPTARRNVWNILLKARAIENQCFVVGSNRIGTDGNGISYSGDSAIIDAKGEIITMADTGLEQCITADILIEELNEFRKKFPVQNDADSFTINP